MAEQLITRFFEQRFEHSNRRVSGYAVVFYDGTPKTEYQLGPNLFERIAPNAFELEDVTLRLMHERKQPLARTPKTLQLRQDSKGIYFDGEILNTRIGEDAIEMVKNDIIRGSSAGFYPTQQKFTREAGKDICTITKGRLEEISLVDRGAYEACTVQLRAYDDWKREEIEKSLEFYEQKLQQLLDRFK